MSGIPAILKGDPTKEIPFTIPENAEQFCVVFQSVVRRYGRVCAGDAMTLQFSAEETATFNLGTYPLVFVAKYANGSVRTYPISAKIKVTDAPALVYGSSVDVDCGDGALLNDVSVIPDRHTQNAVADKVNEIIRKLGGGAAALLLAFSAFGAEVQTAPLGTIYNDSLVVTNVDLSGLEPGNYAAVSNAAMSAAEDIESLQAGLASKRDYFDFTAGIPGIPTASGMGWFAVDGESAEWDGSNYVTPSGHTILYENGGFVFVSNPGTDGHISQLNLAAPDYSALVLGNVKSYTVRGYLPVTLATSRDVDAVTNDLEQLRIESSLIYRLYSGSNAVMEVTNYNSRVNPPAMRLRQLDDNGEYITIWTETNGLARIARGATNYTDVAIAEEAARADNTYASRAWSKTTSGLGAEAPSNTTWISTPQTVIAGGLEFQKVITTSGQLWILRSNGANITTNKYGYLSFAAADGTDIISIEKTDSYLVGVDASSIVVSGNTITMTVPVVSTEPPLLRYTPSLSPVAWEKQEDGFTSPITVTWGGTSGAWTCTVTSSATQGFFAFEFLQEGGTKIVNNGVVDFPQGILCKDGKTVIRPVNTNGTITWEIVR